MAEVLFYHLTETPLEGALPPMLEASMTRGWRVVVRLGSPERAEALNAHLWSYRDDSFLPHGGPGDAAPDRQPIYVTGGDELPNAPDVLMLADGAGATPAQMAALMRTCILFDARDADAVAAARLRWKEVTAAGLKAVYWKQENGKWNKASESAAKP
ncbi:MAG: DNA polymerase-3 subunit chi [Paracoccaceae bacterium]|jgi:DNA polymerase-3 subunit chi